MSKQSDDWAKAAEAVSQMFAQVRSEPTPGEAVMWTDEIARVGPRAVMSFASFWMAGGGQGDYFRAPRIADLRRFLNPFGSTEPIVFARLQKMVQEVGPYRVPSEQQGMDETMRHCVHHLGGWAAVCETMPDPRDEFAFRNFEKRFSGAWAQAQISMARGDRVDEFAPIGATQSRLLGVSNETGADESQVSSGVLGYSSQPKGA